jgi:hypothetical protein
MGLKKGFMFRMGRRGVGGDREQSPIVWFLGLVFVGALLFLIGFFVYNWVVSGQAEGTLKKGWVNVEPGAESAKKGLFDFWRYIVNPAAAREDFDSAVEKNVNNPILGVRITEFEAESPEFYENTPIRTYARVEMAALDKDFLGDYFSGEVGGEIEVDVGCGLEDYYGDVEVQPSRLIYYRDGSLYINSVRCIFPEGIRVNKGVSSKIAHINLSSEYSQVATYRVYFLRKDKYEELRFENVDPFDYYGVTYKYLMPGNEIKSVVTDGPLDIAIGVPRSQPFVEGTEYIPFIVSIENRDLSGYLAEIDSLLLELPEIVEIDTDPNACDFRLIGRSQEKDGDFNVYEVRRGALERALQNYNRYRGLSFSCSFRVAEFPSDFSGMFYNVFKVTMNYKFTVQKKTDVVVRNVEESTEDLCNDIDNYDECYSTKMCKPQTINGSFTKCVRCLYSSCENQYGSNEEKCLDDPCQIGDCYFDGGKCVSGNI